MLELKNIKKTYVSGDDKVEALKGINLKFREAEFVSILGQSGCGKTTLLNIIGGLDRYTSGDLIINGKSTKNFKDRDWDAYRNYKIGFVFQSYNLITHQTVLSNVELALTIGGISKRERRERALKALEEVGLIDQIHKKPNQLSGGQMQRVAIARALVNNPDIILADEPTGALDTKTSVQVMEILKKISKDKLIIMVTHNPDLAKQYSNRIIKILDGVITEDSNPIIGEEVEYTKDTSSIGRTAMSFWTAFRLSLNNLLTKKGRTVLVAFAGSIGIIGIALVQSVSNGFQAYVDSIQEETLTSYPLTIMQETTDIAGTLLAMRASGDNAENTETIKEEQYISKMLANLSTNDLKSFKKYVERNYNEISDDISTIKYVYGVEPNIYTIDATDKVVKLSPKKLFKSSFGTSSLMSSFTSIYSQMIDDKDTLENSYDVLAGHWPENYDEMIIVLTDRNAISDLLVYSLGLRDTAELTEIITKIMSGEASNVNNEPMNFTYDDLLNIELKLVMPTDIYKYNEKFDIYEDMSSDEDFLRSVYDKSENLKIVGIVSAKEGVTSAALNPGVSYTKELIDHIIDYSAETDIVKKQLGNEYVDVLSGKRFDESKNKLDMDFSDLVSVDQDKLKSAFSINIDESMFQKMTEGYMAEIANSISTDITKAREDFINKLKTLAYGLIDETTGEIDASKIDSVVSKYVAEKEPEQIFKELSNKYSVPQDVFKTTYTGALKGLLQTYIDSANSNNSGNIANTVSATIKNTVVNNTTTNNSSVKLDKEKIDEFVTTYINSAAMKQTAETMAKNMTEAFMKKYILSKVGDLTGELSKNIASAFNVDANKIASAFQMNMSEEELTRIATSMLSQTETNAKTNLILFGYQDREEPTYIAFYFQSFDGKEHFKQFIEDYNTKVKENGKEDKEINYTDTTGILMDSVKTIVSAVTYVLIAFISISLVVSSMMIGIITYISVYERTKEIGILRAIGASKKNISSIFNAETFIIGLLSGLFGIGFTYAVIPIINAILHHYTGNIPLNATFYITNAVTLVVLSVILTLIGGLIPAKAASKKDPVIALRTE
ncbi:MAG: ABC transporter ATP-binding protein/permease [Clostridia bacterium]|nr:ABC transporter ATP-binding protein/permease [Clostridia bacterium]